MLDNIFNLFIEVIKAAREGRFMYGNGGDWYIVDYSGNKLYINTVNGTVMPMPYYDGEAHADWTVADQLVQFLLESDPGADFMYDISYVNAVMHKENSIKNGALLHYNGGQVYFKDYSNMVLWVDISAKKERTTMHRMSALCSFQYLHSVMEFSFENSIPGFAHRSVA